MHRYYAIFQCRQYSVFKEKIFLTPKKWQDMPFISQPYPDYTSQPRIDFSFDEISGSDICSLVCVSLKISDHSLLSENQQWVYEWGILFPKFSWPTVKKVILVIKKKLLKINVKVYRDTQLLSSYHFCSQELKKINHNHFY